MLPIHLKSKLKMKTLNFNFRTFATLSFTLLAILLSSMTASANLDGTWLAKDPNTRGLTKAIISNNATKIHVFGQCHPKDCDWDATKMTKRGNEYLAYYDQGFAKRKLQIALTQKGELCIIMYTDYKDSRKDKRDTYFFVRKKVKTHRVTGIVAKAGNWNATIEGANIVFKSTRGKIYKAVSKGAGRYNIQLPKGEYNATASARGYKKFSGKIVVTGLNQPNPYQTFNIALTKIIQANVKEDCVAIDYKTAKVAYIKGRYKIVDGPQGNHYAFDFGSNKAEAYASLKVIKQYKITKSCFVGRPNPSFKYLLNTNGAPTGPMAKEDCVSFNPSKIAVKKVNGRWKIVQGSHWIKDFGNNEKEARQAFAIIKKYKFTKSCFVGRPNPSFEYLRK